MQTIKNHRICIIGNSGSGKSTLAIALGRHLDIPVYHLDRELLHGQFVAYSEEEQGVIHAKFIAGQNWVIDGSYKSFLPARLKKATVVIFLDVSRLITAPRIVARYFKNALISESIPVGAQNQMSFKFIKWFMTYSRRKRLESLKELCSQYPQVKLIVLKSGTIDDWINGYLEYETTGQLEGIN